MTLRELPRVSMVYQPCPCGRPAGKRPIRWLGVAYCSPECAERATRSVSEPEPSRPSWAPLTAIPLFIFAVLETVYGFMHGAGWYVALMAGLLALVVWQWRRDS